MDIFYAFIGGFIIDFLYSLWTIYTSQKQITHATCLAGLLFAISGLVTTLYVDNKWLLIPAVLGAMLGTYVAIRMSK